MIINEPKVRRYSLNFYRNNEPKLIDDNAYL